MKITNFAFSQYYQTFVISKNILMKRFLKWGTPSIVKNTFSVFVMQIDEKHSSVVFSLFWNPYQLKTLFDIFECASESDALQSDFSRFGLIDGDCKIFVRVYHLIVVFLHIDVNHIVHAIAWNLITCLI